VDRAKTRGRDTTSAEGYVKDLAGKADAAATAVAGVPAGVLPLQAADFPGNRAALVSARASLATARGDLTGTLGAASRAIAALKGLG
jgi:hypothetical protein